MSLHPDNFLASHVSPPSSPSPPKAHRTLYDCPPKLPSNTSQSSQPTFTSQSYGHFPWQRSMMAAQLQHRTATQTSTGGNLSDFADVALRDAHVRRASQDVARLQTLPSIAAITSPLASSHPVSRRNGSPTTSISPHRGRESTRKIAPFPYARDQHSLSCTPRHDSRSASLDPRSASYRPEPPPSANPKSSNDKNASPHPLAGLDLASYPKMSLAEWEYQATAVLRTRPIPQTPPPTTEGDAAPRPQPSSETAEAPTANSGPHAPVHIGPRGRTRSSSRSSRRSSTTSRGIVSKLSEIVIQQASRLASPMTTGTPRPALDGAGDSDGSQSVSESSSIDGDSQSLKELVRSSRQGLNAGGQSPLSPIGSSIAGDEKPLQERPQRRDREKRREQNKLCQKNYRERVKIQAAEVCTSSPLMNTDTTLSEKKDHRLEELLDFNWSLQRKIKDVEERFGEAERTNQTLEERLEQLARRNSELEARMAQDGGKGTKRKVPDEPADGDGEARSRKSSRGLALDLEEGADVVLRPGAAPEEMSQTQASIGSLMPREGSMVFSDHEASQVSEAVMASQ